MHLFIIIIIIIIMTMILITVIFTILLITTSMVVVVMIGDGYGLYDDDRSNDHMIIFYSTKDDWSQLLICYVIPHFDPFNQLSLLYLSGAATSSLPKSRRY